jgi:Zn/Cd-binding protein ZinT
MVTEESDVMLQEELTGISTNEELKVQFRKGYQQFWLQRDVIMFRERNVIQRCCFDHNSPRRVLVRKGSRSFKYLYDTKY